MVSFKKKFYLFKLTDTWFRTLPGWKNLFQLNTYSFVQDHKNESLRFCIRRDSYTLISDLTSNINELEEKFSSSVKKEIKKAEADGVEFITNKDLDFFVDFYNEFAGKKSIYQINKKMKDALTTDQYQVTISKYNGEILNAKLYLYDQEIGIVRSFLSANMRSEDATTKRKVGISGKFLMAKSMFYFKEQGFTQYDFGGIAEGTTDKGLLGINEFKASFGGLKQKDVNFDSLPYYFLRNLSKFLDRRYQ